MKGKSTWNIDIWDQVNRCLPFSHLFKEDESGNTVTLEYLVITSY